MSSQLWKSGIFLFFYASAAVFAQTPTVASVVNAASSGPQLCPGLLATVYGTNFGTTAANVAVSVGGKPAYILAPVTAGQMNVQIPFEVSTGATTLTVTVGGAASAPFNITLSAVSPYFLTQNSSGSGLATVYQVTGNTEVTAAAPAHDSDYLFTYAVGLGPTSPATPTGIAPVSASTATLPTVTVGGVAAAVTFAGIPQGQGGGVYQVNFTVPAGVQGTVPLVISIDGVSSSSSVSLALAAGASSQTPMITGVANYLSLGSQLSPGSLAIIYGFNFGLTAANVTVTVGGKAAYVPPTISSDQFNVEIPYEAAAGPTTLTVTVAGVASAPFNITLSATAPAFYTQNSSGSGLAKVLQTSSNTLVTLAAPAKIGDNLYTYAAGLGPTNPPTPTGVVAASSPAATLPTVTVGGVAAKVTAAGTVTGNYGIYQVNFAVPAGVQGTVPLVIAAGGVSSSTTVTIAVTGISYLESNATFASPGTVSPGSIATVFFNDPAVATNVVSGLFPGIASEGAQVTFNSVAAPLFHVIGAPSASSPQQIDLLVPTNLPTTGTVNVQLTTPTASYPNYSLNMAPSNPGFYRIADPKLPTLINVIAQFANSAWLALPVSTTANLGLFACSSIISPLSECGQPATPGDTLVLYATGLGLATPNGNPTGTPLANGQIPPIDGSVLYETPTTPVVTIGGIPAKVLFSGLAPGYPGEYQIDITVPSGVAYGDNIPVVLTILGASDSSTTISIQPRTN